MFLPADSDGRLSRNAAAKHFNLAVSTVVKLLQRRKVV
jgi:hypothetical protein